MRHGRDTGTGSEARPDSSSVDAALGSAHKTPIFLQPFEDGAGWLNVTETASLIVTVFTLVASIFYGSVPACSAIDDGAGAGIPVAGQVLLPKGRTGLMRSWDGAFQLCQTIENMALGARHTRLQYTKIGV